MEQLRNKDTRPMMDLVAKKVFNNTEEQHNLYETY